MEMELGKLFIGGISWDTNEERLREYFQAFGEVVEAVIMKDRTTGRARGFGFVVFADSIVAERVVMEKHMIDGRIVEAKKAVPRDDQQITNRSNSSIHGSPGPARTKKIFVGGLASTVTESDFKRYFDQFGMITDVVVMYDHNTQRPRGFGFITYDSEESVEKVLLNNFHELNGKMVEVKRAVPKELSPGPSRGQLGGYTNYGPTKISNFLNGYTQGYNPSPNGAYGVRNMDGRFSPVTVGRNGIPHFGPSGYGMGLNVEPGLNPGSYGGITNLSSSGLSYGRGLNPYYGGNLNRYGSGGIGSISSSPSRKLWGNDSPKYTTTPANSSAYMGSGTGNTALGSIGAIWGSSPNSNQNGGPASAYNGQNFSYGSEHADFGLGGRGYGRNSGPNMGPVSSSPYTTANSGYDDLYEGGSVFGDLTWKSSTSGLERSLPFGYGLGSNAAAPVITAKDSSNAGLVGGYSVTDRQSNRGIAA